MTDTTTADMPEALRLADALQNAPLWESQAPLIAGFRADDDATLEEAAAELRRLHALTTAAPAAQEAEPAVPVEPTDEMYVAAGAVELPTGDDDGGSIHLNTSQVRQIWQAMRAALYAHPPRPQADAGAPTAVKVTQDMRRVFREAYRVGGFWADRLDHALDRMLAAAAPQAPAAGAAPSLDDLTELVRSLGHSTRRQSVEIASAVLARWGAAAPAHDAEDAARHRAWRKAITSDDYAFLDRVTEALPEHVSAQHAPTEQEWDAAIDAARAKEGKA